MLMFGAGGGSLTRVACLEGRNNKRYTTPANFTNSVYQIAI